MALSRTRATHSGELMLTKTNDRTEINGFNFTTPSRGNHISILYDPGYFPALLENSSSSKLVRRNGGVPQNGDVDRHLELFKLQLDELVPDKDNDGIIVIDFESWRPTFRQNFGVLKPYKDLSIDLARKEFPFNAEARAARAFEQYGKEFMLKTLKLAKQLRPRAQWGYYAFPYCFNGRNKNPERCAAGVNQENRNISWLFKHSDVIFPSVYMSEKMPVDYRIPMVRGRVDEAKRMSVYNSDSKIYTYFRHCYSDTRRNLEEQIVFGAMDAIKNGGSHGVILWGSSNDLNTRYAMGFKGITLPLNSIPFSSTERNAKTLPRT